VLEGGAFDVDGNGSVLVTEECLLSTVQARNPGLGKEGYGKIFAQYLGAPNVIWLKSGCSGDDTHGHIDDIARFVPGNTIVCASAAKDDREQYESSQENLAILRAARDTRGERFNVVELPYPTPLYCDGARLPASYLNFYIANGLVLVPTFNAPEDRLALGILSDLFPNRAVIGIHCIDWVLGYGTLHCSTQQEPKWTSSR
jgi:agmatine deiminase